MMRIAVVTFVALVTFVTQPAPAAERPGYLRDPAVHGDRVFFTAESDLWRAPLAGGRATRLTTHPEEEIQVAVSPDGDRLAFAAAYDGPVEAYVMPTAGGMPRRVSFDGRRVDVLGWSPDGRVLYASRAVSGTPSRRVVRLVDPDTLEESTLPATDANRVSIDPDLGRVAFSRFGLVMTGDQVRRYRGGAMAQLWLLDDLERGGATRLLAGFGAGASEPMWWGERIYFVSDRSGVDNLWWTDAAGAGPVQVTDHARWPVREPSLEGGRIVYRHGAEIRLLELASGRDRAVDVTLQGDFDPTRTRWLESPLDYLDSVSFSPRGDRVALTARGRVALASTGPLRRVELHTPGDSRTRAAVVGHDGAFIYAIGDATGEHEIWRFPADGSGAGEPLTSDGETHRWRLFPSPDGRFIVHSDKRGRLWVLELDGGANRLLDTSPAGIDDGFGRPAWSADGDWIAYDRPGGPRQISQVVLRSLVDDTRVVLTSDRYESFSPAFSPDGRWLYLLSDRTFRADPSSPWGDRNFGPRFDRRTGIYALALQPDARFPFSPPDELARDAADAAETPRKPDADAGNDALSSGEVPKPAVPAPVLDGLAARLFEVPVRTGNYRALSHGEGRLYLLDRATGPGGDTSLVTVEVTDRAAEVATFAAAVSGYELSADRKKLLVRKSGPGAPMLIVDAGAKLPDDVAAATVRTSDWRLAISPRDEWRQMFDDAWRMHRDFSFDPAMRGLDWDEVRASYAPLVERLSDRRELDDLLGLMIGELNILHSQVRGGDLPDDPESAAPAFLGATYESTPDGLRIASIRRTDPELPGERAPLLRPGVDAAVGDLIAAVDGRPVRTRAELARALAHRDGRQVLLELRRGATTVKTVVTPVGAREATPLDYRDWVRGSTEHVERAGGGALGYLHLRAMGPADIASFARDFYANHDRGGLILDVRDNRGGNIDSWVIEKLLRRVWSFWQTGDGPVTTNMQQTFRGHLVVLINEGTYSDGETVAAGIKSLGLAPLIGTRTAGAGIWLSGRNRLSDRGVARIAEYPMFRTDGTWLVEGRGVAPDIEVDNPPDAVFAGRDPQLEAGIDYLLRKLEEEPLPPLRGEDRFPLELTGADAR